MKSYYMWGPLLGVRAAEGDRVLAQDKAHSGQETDAKHSEVTRGGKAMRKAKVRSG